MSARHIAKILIAILSCTQVLTSANAATADALAQFKRQSSLYAIRRIVLSPDSSQLAYVVQVPSDDANRNQLQLRLMNVESKQRVHLCCAEDDATNPSWSPDGKLLAFVKSELGKQGEYKDHGVLSIYDISTKTTQSFPELIGADFHLYPRWLDDHRILVFDVNDKPHRDVQPQPSADGIRVFTSNPTAASSVTKGDATWKDPRFGNIHSASVLDIMTGQVRSVIKETSMNWLEVSPNGRYLAFAEYQESNVKEFVASYVVNIVDLNNGARYRLKQNVVFFSGFWHAFTWRSDSATLAFATLDQMSITGSMSYRVVSGPHWDSTVSFDPPPMPAASATQTALWSADGSYLTAGMGSNFVTWKATGGPVVHMSEAVPGYIQQLAPTLGPQDHIIAIVETMPEHGTKVVEYDPVSNKLHTIASIDQEPMPQWGTAAITRDRDKLLFTGYSLNRFVEAQSLEWNGKKEELTDGDNRPESMYADYKVVTWRDSNGRSNSGGLILPRSWNSKDKLPLVVQIYPGNKDTGEANVYGLVGGVDAHNDNLALVAAGYAVFYPDTMFRPETYPVDLANDVLPGIQKLIDSGIADPDRIGVRGHSDGVQASLNLMASSAQFKAAVLSDGFANFFTIYGDISGYGVQSAPIYKLRAPWETPQRYIDISPLFRLDRINAPILLFHGTADVSVPLYAGEEVFADLRSAGKESTLVEYEGGGHILSTWTLPQQADAMKRTLGWYDQYLKAGKSKNGAVAP